MLSRRQGRVTIGCTWEESTVSDHRTRDEKMQDFVDETNRRLAAIEENITRLQLAVVQAVTMEQLNSVQDSVRALRCEWQVDEG